MNVAPGTLMPSLLLLRRRNGGFAIDGDGGVALLVATGVGGDVGVALLVTAGVGGEVDAKSLSDRSTVGVNCTPAGSLLDNACDERLALVGRLIEHESGSSSRNINDVNTSRHRSAESGSDQSLLVLLLLLLVPLS
jgi:hypothetical protein